MEIYEKIIASGYQYDVVVVNALIDMYAKCGNMLKARELFDKMHQRDAFSWTTMIAGYAYNGLLDEALQLFKKMPQQNVVSWNAMIAGLTQNGHTEEALELLQQMQWVGIRPDSKTLVSILPACADLAALQRGMEIHSLIIRSGFQSDLLVVGNALIDMYAKCGSIDKATQIFDGMHQRDVVSWTAMVAGFAQNGLIDEAMKLFKEMPLRNVASWNAMIAGLSQNEHGEKGLRLFGKMQLAGMRPDSKTFASSLLACVHLVDLKLGLEIHGKIVTGGFQSDVFVMTALVEMYAQCGSIEKAQCLFGMMHHRDLVCWNVMITGYAENGLVNDALKLFKEMPQQNVISWNAIIAGFAQNGHGEDALKIFQQMQSAGMTPDSKTFAIILPVCANRAALHQGFQIHEKVITNGYQSDSLAMNALIDMYAKCGSIEKANKLFDKLNHRDLISWNSMIGGYAMHGCGKEALTLFEQMIHSGIKPNHVSFVSVLSACNHAGLVEEGYQYFTCMSECYDITPTMQHYICMVDLLCRAGRLDEAHEFINKMPITPDAVVLICLLGACRIHNNIELGQCVAERLFELDPENSAPYVLISNIYAAVGRWSDIEKVRKLMKKRGIKKKPGCSWIEVLPFHWLESNIVSVNIAANSFCIFYPVLF